MYYDLRTVQPLCEDDIKFNNEEIKRGAIKWQSAIAESVRINPVSIVSNMLLLLFTLHTCNYIFQRIDQFKDLNDGEKNLMKLWNTFVAENK